MRRILGSVDDLWTRLRALPPVARPGGARAAVLVPLYRDDRGTARVILTARPDTMATHPGDVVFPGGRIEPGEDPVSTAVREAEEEIGLPVAGVEVLGGLTPVTTRDRTNLIVPVVAKVERPVELVPQPEEVAAIIEPRLADLLDESRWRTMDWMGFPMWFYDFDAGTLWGATAFMMRELLDYLRRG